MRGISEEKLSEIGEQIDSCKYIEGSIKNWLLDECEELNDWKPIDENTPTDRPILVYAPSRDGLDYLITTCLWHDDAGFCIDMIREPTHWQELPPLPKETK